ncbi:MULTISPECIES: tyrosine-type recombinase/integrase [unclassified Leptolyngbya]|uniref:tyrosine-type recombinase/integrase n=1 Tax=unclassified Leptolyngbya TaxID=2650499 RepID=UPI001ACFA16C|nr:MULTISPECIES: site-specific integrase [unclassified Leptolyngbya]MBN8562470.1 site-specific integrase [Leptolyngbya sp. UWPOB_LEPTO1]MCY6492130.1 site-specific integrase [Leptolyngbya sp. GGD]
MPKVNGKGQAAILTNDQIDAVISLCRKPYCYVVAIASFTGCRMGEALRLRAENLNLAEKIITLTNTKTGRAREIEMHPELVKILTGANLPTKGYLFPSNRSAGYITRQALDKELREVCEALELRGVGTHSFRRSLATSLHGKGVPIKTIASITGHESLNELSRYLEVTPEQRRYAIMQLR